MAVSIDIEPVRILISQRETYSQIVGNSGFKLYWQSQGREPGEVALALAMADPNRAAALDQDRPDAKSILSGLGRISGASLEQQVARHIPTPMADFQITFVPGGEAPLVAEENIVAVNAFALEQKMGKLFLGDFPLLSLLANRIHRLSTQSLSPQVQGTTCSWVIGNFVAKLLREGSATLFFTMPVSGSAHQEWTMAETQRDAQVDMLRNYLKVKDGDMTPLALAQDLERAFALTGNAGLAARYPLGTWLCQVVEGAFSRNQLLDLFRQPEEFLATFERARIKFGLTDKYSLGWSQ